MYVKSVCICDLHMLKSCIISVFVLFIFSATQDFAPRNYVFYKK